MGRHEARQIWHGTKKCGSCQHKGRSGPCLAFHPGPLGQARHNPNCVARRGTMAGPCGPLGHDPGSPSAPLPRLHIKIPNPPSHRHARCASTPVTTAALSSVAPSSSSPSLPCRADPPPPSSYSSAIDTSTDQEATNVVTASSLRANAERSSIRRQDAGRSSIQRP
jgi:hypothetical protein